MECPHCHRPVNKVAVGRAASNVAHYGENSFVFRCRHCLCKYRLHFIRHVSVCDNAEPVSNEQTVDYE